MKLDKKKKKIKSTTHHIGTYFWSRPINELALFVSGVAFAGQMFVVGLIFDFEIIFTGIVLKAFTVSGPGKWLLLNHRSTFRCLYHRFCRRDDLLQILGQKMSTASGPGPRMRVVIQHPRHDTIHSILLSKIFALVVVVVWHTQPER